MKCGLLPTVRLRGSLCDLPFGDADYCGRLESQPPHVEVISYLKIGVIE